jgi:hypothetical protein
MQYQNFDKMESKLYPPPPGFLSLEESFSVLSDDGGVLQIRFLDEERIGGGELC